MNILKLISFMKLVGTDPDAQAFIDAAGLSDSTQKSAINNLVKDLKNYGIWSKMLAIYPLVGGTKNTCKYNLKDPRDLDAAYRFVEINGNALTYSNNGVLGSAGQLDTKMPFSTLNYNSASISMYIRQPLTDMNGSAFGDDGQVFIGKRFGGAILQLAIGGSYGSAATGNSSTGTSPKGFITGGTNGSRLTKLWANNIAGDTGIGSTTATSTTIKLLNPNNQVTNGVQVAFASIGNGLTDAEHQNFYTAVQAFQTTLGRQV